MRTVPDEHVGAGIDGGVGHFDDEAGGHLAALGALVLIAYGAAAGSLSLPKTFWLTLALYPAWGIVQQFALQNLIARNLAGILRSPLGLASAAELLFGASHYPRLDLVALTLAAGVFFTLIYRAVRLFGGIAWMRNAADRAAGFERVLDAEGLKATTRCLRRGTLSTLSRQAVRKVRARRGASDG